MSTRVKLFKVAGLIVVTALVLTGVTRAEDEKPAQAPVKTKTNVARPDLSQSETADQELTNIQNALHHEHALSGRGAGGAQSGGQGAESGYSAAGGSNIGGSDRASACMISPKSALADAMSCARLDIVGGNNSDARDALLQGLVVSLQNLESRLDPFNVQQGVLVKVYSQGLDMLSGLDQMLQKDSSRLAVEVKVLRAYYDFTQSALAGSVPDSVSLARAQLSWLIENFTDGVSVADGTREIHAQIDDAVYLKMAELMTGYAASNLDDGNSSDSCGPLADELSTLSQKLARHNLGDATFENNNRIAINLSFPQIHDGAKNIPSVCAR